MGEIVTSREGRVSRNPASATISAVDWVTSREGRVSRNAETLSVLPATYLVTSREGRVSRNPGAQVKRHRL